MQPRGGAAPVPMSYCGRCRRRQKGPLTRPGRPSEPPQLRGWTQAHPSENRPQGGIGRVHHRLSRPLGTSGLVLDPSNGLGHDIDNDIGLEPRLTTGARVVGAPNGPADQRARRPIGGPTLSPAWTAMTGTGAVGQRAKNRPLCFVEETLPLGQPLSRCPCNDGRMKRKQQFLKAVRILAPGDKFILQAAQRAPEEHLPARPGGAALELVVALQKAMASASDNSSSPNRNQPESRSRNGQDQGQLSLSQALRIRSAHYWLELGEADQALRELEALPSGAWGHPLAVSVRVAALRAVEGMNIITVQE